MAFDLIDLTTAEIYGPFMSHREARESARRSQITSYAIWEDGRRVEIIEHASQHDYQNAIEG